MLGAAVVVDAVDHAGHNLKSGQINESVEPSVFPEPSTAPSQTGIAVCVLRLLDLIIRDVSRPIEIVRRMTVRMMIGSRHSTASYVVHKQKGAGRATAITVGPLKGDDVGGDGAVCSSWWSGGSRGGGRVWAATRAAYKNLLK